MKKLAAFSFRRIKEQEKKERPIDFGCLHIFTFSSLAVFKRPDFQRSDEEKCTGNQASFSAPCQKMKHPKPPAVFENISLVATGSPKTAALTKLQWASTRVLPGQAGQHWTQLPVIM